ncbi:MAG TPA: cytochrome c3 family protein [Pyrinomonadaceae bacterium]|nr:cytochrome c3 family protein [Pyrinomonadaceae bacterium]
MKRVLTALIVVLSAGAMLVVGNAARTSASIGQQIPKESKEQPKKLKLGTDSLDDKWGEIAFDHENHTIKNYSPDGKTAGTCVECHHTDQPKEKLTPPLVTSERNVVLTADVLKDAAAAPVKGCRSCHLQAGDDTKPLPVITKDNKQVKLDNEVAYHTNCFACHDAAIKARPDLATKISGSDPKGCNKCHSAK